MVSQTIFEIRALGGEEFKRELERWLRDEQQQGDLMVAEVFRCLREEYLCSLPLPKGVQWPVVPKSRNFRFFFFFLLSCYCVHMKAVFVVIKHLVEIVEDLIFHNLTMNCCDTVQSRRYKLP